MNIFKSLGSQNFINDYWQQQTKIIRQSCSDLVNIIDGDSLASFACDQDVESRIIFGYGLNADWKCKDGPFSENYFASLASNNWSLLIQGLNHLDNNIDSILKQFDFLPSWRLEDIMASYAPIGGGVGPHFDYYDVFLIQISGKREWKIGQSCDENTQLQKNDDVKLISGFNSSETHCLEAGDLIYIPAGIAHWGTALTNDCITISIGFRAPSEKELLSEMLSILFSELDEDGQYSSSTRYKDTVLAIDSHPYKINANALDTANKLAGTLNNKKIKAAAAIAFGRLVTDIKHSPINDYKTKLCWTESELQNYYQENKKIKLYCENNVRLAYTSQHLFVNGNSYATDETFSHSLCDKLINSPLSSKQAALMVLLLNQQLIKIVN